MLHQLSTWLHFRRDVRFGLGMVLRSQSHIILQMEKQVATTSDLMAAVDRLANAQVTLINGLASANAELKRAHEDEDSEAIAAAVTRIDELTKNAITASASTPSSSGDVGQGGTSVSGNPVPVSSGGGNTGTGSTSSGGDTGSGSGTTGGPAGGSGGGPTSSQT